MGSGTELLLKPVLTEDEQSSFESDGFLVARGPFVSHDDLAEVARLLDPLFDRFGRYPNEFAHDLGGVKRVNAPSIPEVEYVTTLIPKLGRSRVVSTFRALGRSYFGKPVALTFDHAIYKPARSMGVTPWHQDSSTDASGRETLTVWIPLQDTDESNGCMRYVQGSQQRGRVPHQPIPERHGMTPVDPIDESLVRTAPVAAGGAVLHREHTLHSAGPNPGPVVRRALILQVAPRLGLTDTAMLALTRAKVARARHAALRNPR